MENAKTVTTTRESRKHTREQSAQRRLADLAFSRFMREHNAKKEH